MSQITLIDSSMQSAISDCFELHRNSQPFPWSKSTFADMTTTPYCLFAVINESQCIDAYAIVLRVLDEITLMDIAVIHNKRNHGIGNALMVHLLTHFKRLDITRCLLEVRAGNIPAIKLYEKLGFQTIDIRKKYYPATSEASEREDAWVMQYQF